MKASNIRSTIADNQICFASIKMSNNHFGRPSISDVSLHLYNTFYRGHRLQVNCNNERKVTFLEIRGLFCWYIQVPAQNLAPASRSSTQINHTFHSLEDVELLVYLEELEGAASSPSFLLGLPVVDVPLVLGGLAHGGDEADREQEGAAAER